MPAAARWREWMLRVEAAIFASAKPVPREALVRLVGETCRFDDLIADLIHELRGRPYDLTLVAGGYALAHQNPLRRRRSAPRIPDGEGMTLPGADPDRDVCPDRDRLFAAGHARRHLETGGAGDQPRRDRSAQAPRPDRTARSAPLQPGAPFAYVTTRTFLEAFGFASLRDLPDLEQLKAEPPTAERAGENDLDSALRGHECRSRRHIRRQRRGVG